MLIMNECIDETLIFELINDLRFVWHNKFTYNFLFRAQARNKASDVGIVAWAEIIILY